jgi:hypothetical protein
MFLKARRILSTILLVISVSMIIWASLPDQHLTVTQFISPSEIQLSSSAQTSIPKMIENRQVVLDWPRSMRIGETKAIILVFEPVENEASSPMQQPESSNMSNNYNIMAEARFEVAGIIVSPANPIRESMPDRQTVKFKWQISTEYVGSYDGTVWLFLRFLPLDGSQAIQVPIFIRDVGIKASSLFGMTETKVYFVGGAGIVLAVIFVFSDMIGLVRRRMRKIPKKVLNKNILNR